jgi:sugar phosphate isomerase/epimerase
MRLGISNIAWDIAEDDAVAVLLHRFGVDAVDVAPGKYFPDPIKATSRDIARVRREWWERGIELTGMQSLLFGATGLNLFGPPKTRDMMLRHLNAVCRIGEGLGARRLVFGSPRNRDRDGLSDEVAMDMAVSFFQRLGKIAQNHGVTICLEPNPVCYGANFMTTCEETARVVKQVAHPAIRMQLDTGALTINGEDPAAVLEDCAALIGHVHASEPNLLPLGDGKTDHARMFAALNQYLPDHVVAVVMLTAPNEARAASIERALAAAIRHYRDNGVETGA